MRFVEKLARPVTLADVKAEPALGNMKLVKLSRLSVSPVTDAEWKAVLAEENAKPMGNWTVLANTDGTHQWAYKGVRLWTNTVESRPGELVGLRTITRCLKNRVGPPLGESELEIRYPLGPQLPFSTPVIEVPLEQAEMECASAVV